MSKDHPRLLVFLILLFALSIAWPCAALADRGLVAFRVQEAFVQMGASVQPKVPSFWYCAGTAQLPPGAIVVGEGKPALTQRGRAAGDDLDDYETETAATISDPFEGWNRFWFAVNDRFYMRVADPVYRAWQQITPEPTRWALKNFFHNALFPVRFLNNLLQFKLKAAGVEFSRFMMDTMCSAGFSNPSKRKKTIVTVDSAGEDFGQTLGVWGLGPGPYIVWPLIGPSTLRDSIGRVGDLFADPFFYLQPWWLATSTAGVLRVNDLDTVLPLYKDLRSVALDPYISMRDAYVNYRKTHINQ